MKEKLKKYLKEIIFFIVSLTIILNIVSYYRSLDLNKEKLSIKSFKLLNNQTYNIAKDKPIIIHFWATWCPTCKIEAPNIQRLSKDYEVITIAVQSKDEENIKKYLKNNKLSFKVINDIDGYFSRKFNIKAFPTTLIYDKNKNLRFSEVGYTSTFGLFARVWWID
ncbi:redoxin domain-containing protein [Malaciobacter marinus]|jgi:thiol-disulfide isomerase/thioredoxin|uniref:Thiol-disulfide isomerase/thioredoxin n=1 Tax=Malaciobacter marinus TaxID=505249 RepID=A0AB37A084_9BACT|nr:redoxin domain-containing protein [Malaciobacter marinus]PPK62976.1 thiol-disulfide isomerase/thioredoxin [Malaciobacter marinus]